MARGYPGSALPFNFKRPWSNSQDATTPSLRRRSVTGWPYHLNMSRTSLCREVSKTTQAWGSTRAACHGDVADKECTCLASRVMRRFERYPPSPPPSLGVVPASRL